MTEKEEQLMATRMSGIHKWIYKHAYGAYTNAPEHFKATYEVDDLVQLGRLRIIEQYAKYDSDRGNFVTWTGYLLRTYFINLFNQEQRKHSSYMGYMEESYHAGETTTDDVPKAFSIEISQREQLMEDMRPHLDDEDAQILELLLSPTPEFYEATIDRLKDMKYDRNFSVTQASIAEFLNVSTNYIGQRLRNIGAVYEAYVNTDIEGI